MCALSPSASFSSTGRMSPRLERGPCEVLPKAAATPPSRESAGTESTSAVRFGSCDLFMAQPSASGGVSTPGSGQERFSHEKNGRKRKKSGKCLQETCRFLFQFL